jgi:hypothetical protein
MGHGKVRIIDWHLAELCGCEEECMELANLMDDISCPHLNFIEFT